MNILYLNHYAGGPAFGMEFRPYYLAREWVRSGHAVCMVAASYSHLRSKQPVRPLDQEDGPWRQYIDGISYRWYETAPYSTNGIGRLRNIAQFLLRVTADARRMVADFQPDVVIASSTYPMDIWVARRLARLAKARLVFEVHDLWPLTPIELGGMSRYHPFVLLCQAAEDAAYRDADIVISMLPKVADHMASRGLDLSKLHIVPNGISPEDWQQHPEPLRPDIAEFVTRQHAAGRLLIGYAGSHGVQNALEVLLDAASILHNEPFAFVLVGDGMQKPGLQRLILQKHLDRVALFDPIPKGQIPTLLDAIDVAYIGWRRLPIYRFGIAPNKLLDYMMAGKAVLHSVEAGNDPVAEAECGLTVPPESGAAIAEGLRRLARLSPEARGAMGLRGREYVKAHHTYPVLAKRFLRACAV